MKKLTSSTFSLVSIICILFFTSCQKEEKFIELENEIENQLIQTTKEVTPPTISNYEASEIIGSYFEKNSSGLTTIIDDVIAALIQAALNGELCGELINFQVDESYDDPLCQAAFTSDISLETTCQFFIPTTADISVETSANLYKPFLQSENESTFTGLTTGLGIFDPVIAFEGNYLAQGSQTINIFETKTLTSSLSLSLSEFTIIKSELKIGSGSGDLLFTATTQGTTFEFIGDLLFHGDNTATLSINGEVFDLDWN